MTSDSINIKVCLFNIEREGPLSIESGQNKSIKWSGFTVTPVVLNITINGIILHSLNWTGVEVTLDLSNMSPGLYNTTISITNASELIHSKTFWITIHTPSQPIITTLQSNFQEIIWNDILILSWNLTDISDLSWKLFLNDTLFQEGSCDGNSCQVIWRVPVLTEALYNITIEATDSIGLRTSDTTLLTINTPILPVISSIPEYTEIQWNQENVSFIWEIHGGLDWTVWKNGSMLKSGDIENNMIEVMIEDWWEEQWRLGFYNLSLVVSYDLGHITSTIWVTVSLNLGDSFADAVVETASSYYLFGENAIDAPDNIYSLIFVDYSDGYLTLDMGESEEIIDGEGDDFRVIAKGGNYSVYISATLESFTFIGRVHGNGIFDLGDTDFESIRYVRIRYYNGGAIELDAIEALNYNIPNSDFSFPNIPSIEDVIVWSNETSVTLTWSATDLTPWSYGISLNEDLVELDTWNGSSIVYVLEPLIIGIWNITLSVEDVFGNVASDTVFVEVKDANTSRTPTSTIPGDSDGSWLILGVISASGFGLIIIFLITRYRQKII